MRVLFVDDEPEVLAGLENLLRKDRHRWEMVFAGDAQSALNAMAKDPVDVVVSDIRMPGTPGTSLLNEVRQRYPAAARIVLSGHAEHESIVRSLPVAHQFLSKPCEATTLRFAIERTDRKSVV